MNSIGYYLKVIALAAFGSLGSVALGTLLAWLIVNPAWPHDAPTGWTYPYACCSGFDCREVTYGPEGLIREHEDGYQVSTTGEVIARTDGRLKDSPDGQTHWCSIAGSDDTRTICLFVPPAVF